MKQIPIFIINLKKDTEKKQHMLELCKKHSLKCQFVEAVYGRDLDKEHIENITDKEKSKQVLKRELALGELGCTLSHMGIYEQMIDQNIENAIIFEDDIVLEEGFSSVVDSSDNFPEDWEIMLLGHYSNVFDELETKASFRGKKNIFEEFESVRLAQLAYGTHGYMINKKGAKKLLKELTKIVKPIDHYTGVDTYVNMYAIRPRVVKLSEKFKDQSNIDIERDEKKDGDNLSMRVQILRKLGLINILLDMKTTYNRSKKLKKYN